MFSLLLAASCVQLLVILQLPRVILVLAFRCQCSFLESENTYDDYRAVGNDSVIRRRGPDQRQRIQTKQRLSYFNRNLVAAVFLFISTQKHSSPS